VPSGSIPLMEYLSGLPVLPDHQSRAALKVPAVRALTSGPWSQCRWRCQARPSGNCRVLLPSCRASSTKNERCCARCYRPGCRRTFMDHRHDKAALVEARRSVDASLAGGPPRRCIPSLQANSWASRLVQSTSIRTIGFSKRVLHDLLGRGDHRVGLAGPLHCAHRSPARLSGRRLRSAPIYGSHLMWAQDGLGQTPRRPGEWTVKSRGSRTAVKLFTRSARSRRHLVLPVEQSLMWSSTHRSQVKRTSWASFYAVALTVAPAPPVVPPGLVRGSSAYPSCGSRPSLASTMRTESRLMRTGDCEFHSEPWLVGHVEERFPLGSVSPKAQRCALASRSRRRRSWPPEELHAF